LKEKLLAAVRGGIKTVLIPKENEKELKEINPNVLKDLEVILVENMDEVLKFALLLEDPSTLFKEAPSLDIWKLMELQEKLKDKTVPLEH